MTTVGDLMIGDPIILDEHESVTEGAKAMSESDVGAVLVSNDGALSGIATNRDIVVRLIAKGIDPAEAQLGEICSRELHSLRPDDTVDDAVRLMREHAVRRTPVVEDDHPVGVLSLGDLALAQDPESALADICEAPPNT